MRFTWRLAAVVSTSLFLSVDGALAQQPYYQQPVYPYGQYPGTGPLNRPQLSPYLNLLRGGLPAANYYQGVVPERERRMNDRIFGTAINNLERRVDTPVLREGETEILQETGHAAYFQSYAPYYNFPGRGVSGQTAPYSSPRGTRGR